MSPTKDITETTVLRMIAGLRSQALWFLGAIGLSDTVGQGRTDEEFYKCCTIQLTAKHCFDREIGAPINSRTLKTYRQALAQYPLSPELKFLNGEPFDIGFTQRRHIEAIGIHHIGKEANRCEEQFHLGFDEDEQVEYVAQINSRRYLDSVRREIGAAGQRRVVRATGISRRTIAGFVTGKRIRKGLIAKVVRSLRAQKA